MEYKRKNLPNCPKCGIKLKDKRSKTCFRCKDHSYKIGRKISEETRKKMSNKSKNPSKELRNRWSLSHKGEKSHLWRGGITPLINLIRTCFKYRQWRSDVYTRDDFTCQFCFQKGGKLNADHIKPFSVIFRENNIKSVEQADECIELWNINNGRTLCIECHRKTDTWGEGAKKYNKNV